MYKGKKTTLFYEYPLSLSNRTDSSSPFAHFFFPLPCASASEFVAVASTEI